jgi:pantoate--beta-alanine ligase
MNLIERIDECRHAIRTLKADGKRVGFVPTMGALHDGHLKLVETSLRECDATVVSIFVNPTQFNDAKDFESYPVDLKADIAKLEALGAVDIVFSPSSEDMYPKGSTVTVSPGPMGELLEGMTRQGHFRGVLTVVAKLFSMVQPDTAFFGAKDFQQFALISKMTLDLNLPVELRMVDTVREEDGLAMSSRNQHLTEGQREEAPILFQALEMGKRDILAGTPSMEALSKMMTLVIENSICEVDYFSIIDPLTLEDLQEVEERQSFVIVVAAYFGKTRLIDNIMHVSAY